MRPAFPLRSALALALCAWAAGPAWAKSSKASKSPTMDIPAHYRDIRFPDFAYQPPYPPDYRVALDRGAVAYLVPDSSLALAQVNLYSGLPDQPARPADAAPLALYSSLLVTGGTARFTPDRLQDSLEYVAASLSASLGDYQATASLDCMAKDVYPLLDLLPEALLRPRLDPALFKLNQKKALEALRHRYDTPGGVMRAAYEKVLYGSHPSNWQPEPKEVEALTPAKLKAYAGRGFTADRLVFAVSGQFRREDMVKALNRVVAMFPPGPAKDTAIKPFKGPMAPGVYLVDKDVTQAHIQLGAPGVRRPDPDYYRLLVASYIFGEGGFTSRLMDRVRSNEGLAYDVGSYAGSDYHRRSTVGVELQTKVETGAYAVKLCLEEMRRMAKEGITDAELQGAKDGLIKSLPAIFSTPEATASIFAQGEVWGRSPEHFKQYAEAIRSMTRQEVERTFAKYFVADSMRIVVVGPKAVLLRKDAAHQAALSDFGAVKELSLADLDKRE